MKVISFDIEANGFLETATRVWCITAKVYRDVTQKWSLADIPASLAHLSSADVLVGHNIINYDLPMLKKHYGWEPKKGCIIVDTYIWSRTLDPDRSRPFDMKGKKGPHSLEAWGYRVGRGKPDHEDWDNYSPEMLHRCAEDTEITELTFDVLLKEAGVSYDNPFSESGDWTKALLLEQRIQLYINSVEANKFPVNAEAIAEHVGWLQSEMVEVEKELLPKIPAKPKQRGVTVNEPFKRNGDYKAMVYDWLPNDAELVSGPFTRIDWEVINLGSDKQVKEYLLSIGWKPTQWNYKKVTEKESADPSSPYYRQTVGREALDQNRNKVRTGPKLTEDSFDSLQGDIGERVAYFLRCRHRCSLLVGLLELEAGTGRVAQRFTGLTSTGRYKHAGVVNIPGTGWFGHEIRACFVTLPNYKLVGTDAASCQLRMLAHYMNDPDYIKVVVSGVEVDDDGIYIGTDVHTTNGIACGLIDRADVEFCRGKSEELLEKEHHALYAKLKLQRRKAKNFIYGFLFGAGPAKISQTIGCTVADAEKIMTNFTRSLPALKRLLDKLDKVYKTRGYFVGLDGRHIVLRSPHMKLVYLLQGAEATFMKVAWCFLQEGCKRAGLEVLPVCFMHDEFQDLVLDEHVDEYVGIARNAFIRAGTYLKLNCPTDGTPKVGNNWGETH